MESRYLDNLIGEYPAEVSVYESRSPLRSAFEIKCPLLILQGTEDKVVPPDQAVLMYEAVRQNQVPVGLMMFEGEGHGWRKAETICTALNAELNFYGIVFGFTPDVHQDVPIEYPANYF
jgi:dipeptidyl aminopeptidase/acylaminoacyl peptidase